MYATGERLYIVDASATDATPVEIPLDTEFEGTVDDEASAEAARGSPRWPHVLPGGRHALVTVDEGTISVDLSSFGLEYVFAGGQARYLPTGHLVFHAGQGRVRTVPFDLGRRQVTGGEQPVVDNVFRGPGSGAANFAVAAEAGTLVYALSTFNRRLVLVDRDGREAPIPAEPRGYRFPAVSPTGRHIAVTVDPRPSDLWVVDAVSGTAERQRTDPHDGWGVWSPDGRRLAFAWGAGAPLAWRSFPFSPDAVTLIRHGQGPTYPTEWTRDGRLLANTGRDIVAVSIDDGTVDPLIATEAAEFSPSLSPDGRWLAFASNTSGANEVYVTPYPAVSDRYQITRGGGVDPAWSADGSELYYRQGDAIMAVPVATGARFEVRASPVELFAGPYDFTQVANWDVTPDGRFVMVLSDPSTTTRLQVVLNWYRELLDRE